MNCLKNVPLSTCACKDPAVFSKVPTDGWYPVMVSICRINTFGLRRTSMVRSGCITSIMLWLFQITDTYVSRGEGSVTAGMEMATSRSMGMALIFERMRGLPV